MPSINCERCGMALAFLDRTNDEPVLRLTPGLTFRGDGHASCPGYGSAISVNFCNLRGLPLSTPNTIYVPYRDLKSATAPPSPKLSHAPKSASHQATHRIANLMQVNCCEARMIPPQRPIDLLKHSHVAQDRR